MYIGEAFFSNMTWVQTTISTVAACMGHCWEIICKERDTLSEAVVSLRSVVTFVTWLILEQSFLVRNLFYNEIFLDVLFMRLDGERRLSRCLPNISTFVPNDRSQCLYCVLPIVRCAFGTHLDVGLADLPIVRCAFGTHLDVGLDEPRADSLEIWRFLPSFLGKMAIVEKTESLKVTCPGYFCGSNHDSLSYSLVPLSLPLLT